MPMGRRKGFVKTIPGNNKKLTGAPVYCCVLSGKPILHLENEEDSVIRIEGSGNNYCYALESRLCSTVGKSIKDYLRPTSRKDREKFHANFILPFNRLNEDEREVLLRSVSGKHRKKFLG